MQQKHLVALQTSEGAEPHRPELHTEAICGLQDLNFGPDIKHNFTSNGDKTYLGNLGH